MATTLGKRARALDESSTLTSCKRRARFPLTTDENADPDHAERGQEDYYHDEYSYLGELDDPFSGSKCASEIAVNAEKIATLPQKFSEETKRSKSSQGCEEILQLRTPKTPRHRDALSKKVPVTPRHRVTVAGKPLTPRTPRTPLTPGNVPTIYNIARQLFVRSANPGRLIGREEERCELNAFIQGGIKSRSGCCMYVSGPPGTGKSALVAEVCGELQGEEDVQKAYINCMSVKNSKDIYYKLIEDLSDNDMNTEGDGMAILRAMFLPKKNSSTKVYVVTLDEIDHLLTLDLEILYTLFEWSLNRSSRLILIGIANALDLTDRFLPRLKARNLKPQILPFMPYTVPQIALVIITKLQSLLPPSEATTPSFVPFLHPAAIQFCSKKVASQTGDLRKAFDIIRKSIDLIEIETKQKRLDEINSKVLQTSPSKAPLVENINLSSPSSPSSPPRTNKKPITLTESLARLTAETAPRATTAHMARVAASAFNNGTAQRLQSLNLQQKAALCALVALEKKQQSSRSIFATPSKSANLAPTIRKLYEMYCSLCNRENALHPLTATEFTDVIGSLETLSLVGGVEGKGGVLGLGLKTPSKKTSRAEDRRVGSFVNEKEVEGCLEGVGGGILRGLLRGDE